MYKLFIDKNENFECDVTVKNASLKNSITRLVVESEDGNNLIFNGHLNGNKCIIPIKKLRGVLDENSRGKIHLEIIVEDTYFKPWTSNFIVEEHTSIKVKINENVTSYKPTVKVSSPVIKRHNNIVTPTRELLGLCRKFNIRKENIQSKKHEFSQLLKEYFKLNPEYNKQMKIILSGIYTDLK